MKKYYIFVILFVIVFFTGCSNNTTKDTINKIDDTLYRVNAVVNKLELVSSDMLYVNKYIDENNSSINIKETIDYEDDDDYKNGFNGSTFTSADLNNGYMDKIYSLSITAQNAIEINNNTSFLINCINTKSDNIETICDLLINKNCKLDNDQKSINEICNNIILNSNRLMITKDEVKTETKNVVIAQKKSNIDNLTNKYNILINAIETKNTYLNNVCNGLDNIYLTLSKYRCSSNINTEETRKTWSNIDTYRKESTNNNKINKSEENNNNFKYYNYNYGQPGYGGTNPFYGSGAYGGMSRFGGFMGYGRYPYSPYSNYNPYIPNIDTFGTYTNVDTYRPANNIEINEENNSDKQSIKNDEHYYPYMTLPYYHYDYYYPYYCPNCRNIFYNKYHENSNYDKSNHIISEDEKTNIEKLDSKKNV